jgi:DNA-binding MarR family transcriptional regulator
MSEPNRKFKGVWIPKRLWECSELSWLQILVLAEIDSLSDESSGCTAKNEWFSKRFRTTPHAMSQMLSKLAAKGWIKVVIDPDKTRHLWFQFPDGTASLPSDGGDHSPVTGSSLPSDANGSTYNIIRKQGEYSTDGQTTEKEQEDVHLKAKETLLKKWREKGFPLVRAWTADRDRLLRARMKEQGFREGWEEALDRFSQSTFVREKWKPTIDVFLRVGMWAAILEGKYDERRMHTSPTGITDQQFRAAQAERDRLQEEIRYEENDEKRNALRNQKKAQEEIINRYYAQNQARP